MMTRTLPVKEFYIRLERVRDTEAAAEMWRQYVRAHGWSKVGEPEVVRHDDPRNHEGTPFVIGKVVRTDEPLELSPEIGIALRLS
jgi:hypothetical protein